jgi:asparagine synthase (glutamine-hydrolysing)
MCGISGFFKNSNLLDEGVLQRMAKSITHRGPDATGYYQDNHVGLAHNRLSLLDLSSNGDQPFKDEKYCLIYNGEIYNFQEIKKKLPFS